MSNVPKLRFCEFSGKWEEKKLGDIGTFKNGLNKSKEDFGFGHPFVNLMDVFGKDVVFNENFDLVNANEKDLQLYNLIQGDILFIRSSVKREGVGETVLILDDLENTTYSGFLIRFREKNDVFNLLYKKYCFKTKNFRNNLLALSTTSANTNINQESLNTLEINIPSKPEQEKIASFLTSVDTKIEQLTKKEALLKEYKKGLMNKIFNQEIRFKDDDGSEFPEWEEKTLNELVTFKNGKAHENDIVDNGKYIVVNSKFISSDGQKAKYSDSQITPLFKNDIVMVMSDVPNGKALAKCFFIEEDDKYSLNQRICALKQTSNNNKFLIYLINRNKYYLSFDSGVGQTNLKRNEVLDLILNMPCIQEQTKIANFLSSIDNKIEQTTKQLNSTKEFKKALLQQMFV